MNGYTFGEEPSNSTTNTAEKETTNEDFLSCYLPSDKCVNLDEIDESVTRLAHQIRRVATWRRQLPTSRRKEEDFYFNSFERYVEKWSRIFDSLINCLKPKWRGGHLVKGGGRIGGDGEMERPPRYKGKQIRKTSGAVGMEATDCGLSGGETPKKLSEQKVLTSYHLRALPVSLDCGVAKVHPQFSPADKAVKADNDRRRNILSNSKKQGQNQRVEKIVKLRKRSVSGPSVTCRNWAALRIFVFCRTYNFPSFSRASFLYCKMYFWRVWKWRKKIMGIFIGSPKVRRNYTVDRQQRDRRAAQFFSTKVNKSDGNLSRQTACIKRNRCETVNFDSQKRSMHYQYDSSVASPRQGRPSESGNPSGRSRSMNDQHKFNAGITSRNGNASTRSVKREFVIGDKKENSATRKGLQPRKNLVENKKVASKYSDELFCSSGLDDRNSSVTSSKEISIDERQSTSVKTEVPSIPRPFGYLGMYGSVGIGPGGMFVREVEPTRHKPDMRGEQPCNSSFVYAWADEFSCGPPDASVASKSKDLTCTSGECQRQHLTSKRRFFPVLTAHVSSSVHEVSAPPFREGLSLLSTEADFSDQRLLLEATNSSASLCKDEKLAAEEDKNYNSNPTDVNLERRFEPQKVFMKSPNTRENVHFKGACEDHGSNAKQTTEEKALAKSSAIVTLNRKNCSKNNSKRHKRKSALGSRRGSNSSFRMSKAELLREELVWQKAATAKQRWLFNEAYRRYIASHARFGRFFYFSRNGCSTSPGGRLSASVLEDVVCKQAKEDSISLQNVSEDNARNVLTILERHKNGDDAWAILNIERPASLPTCLPSAHLDFPRNITNTASDLKKLKSTYRSTLRLVHPDKNRHPLAKEAFRVAFEAWSVVSSLLCV